MLKRSWLLGICPGLLGLAIGVATMLVFHSSHFIPPLKVIGDVVNSYTLQDLKGIGKPVRITFQGTRYRAVKLADVIEKADPAPNISQLYLVGADGFVSAVKVDSIDDCFIAYTSKNGWEAVNLKHPVNSNVKLLTEIVVVSNGDTGDFAFNVISQDSNLAQITPGKLLTGSLKQYLNPEGKAVVQNNGKDYESQVFTRCRIFKLSDLIPVKDGEAFLVMGEKGECSMADNRSCFEVKDNYVNCLQPETRTVLEKVKGVIVRPPAASIMDVYYDTEHYLNGGDKLLVAALDGLAYNQYRYAASKGYAPFLKNSGKVIKASGVYPLEINVGLAALLTGQTAGENGILASNDQRLKAPSIFAEANRLNKKTLYLEADRKRLETEIQPVSVTDQDADGNSDDELYQTAMDNLDKGYDLIVLRFHDIDSAGQRYGNLAQPTMRTISAADKYLQQIIDKWTGKVIITGNQGTRSSRLNGGKGQFTNDNMFVPYWRFQ